jgi:hypothetical protein
LDDRHRLRQRAAIGVMSLQQKLRLAHAGLDGEGARNAERVEAVNVAAGRKNGGRPQEIAARRRRDVAPVQRVEQGRDLVIDGEQPVRLREGPEQCPVRFGRSRRRFGRGPGDQGRDRGAIGPGAMRGIGKRQEHVDALLHRGRLADDVQPMRDQRVFEFQNRGRQRRHTGLCAPAPGRLRVGEIDLRRLRLDQGRELKPLPFILPRQPAPTLDRGLEVDQAAIQPRMRDRRREIADERRRHASLGDGALGRIVRGVKVEIGQVADEPVRPALARKPGLLARHELERAVSAEMQNRVRPEILAQVAIEGREGMGRRKTLLEEKPHRIALVTEGGLHADHDVAEAFAQDKERGAVALLTARRRAPLRLDLRQVRLAPDMIVRRDPGHHVGACAEAGPRCR